MDLKTDHPELWKRGKQLYDEHLRCSQSSANDDACFLLYEMWLNDQNSENDQNRAAGYGSNPKLSS